MWEPRRITTLWAFTACYRDSFTFLPLQLRYNNFTTVMHSFERGSLCWLLFNVTDYFLKQKWQTQKYSVRRAHHKTITDVVQLQMQRDWDWYKETEITREKYVVVFFKILTLLSFGCTEIKKKSESSAGLCSGFKWGTSMMTYCFIVEPDDYLFINPLKHSGYCICFNINELCIFPRACICVSYYSQNKLKIFHYTTLTNWSS
jgi:hypothetical protein